MRCWISLAAVIVLAVLPWIACDSQRQHDGLRRQLDECRAQILARELRDLTGDVNAVAETLEQAAGKSKPRSNNPPKQQHNP